MPYVRGYVGQRIEKLVVKQNCKPKQLGGRSVDVGV